MDEIRASNERAEELRCLYAVDGVLSDRGQTPSKVFLEVLQALPAGWQRPESTGARIEYLGRSWVGPGFSSDGKSISHPLRLRGVELGRIVFSDNDPSAMEGDRPFLSEEDELLGRVARRLGEFSEWKHTELSGERTPSNAVHRAWRQRFAEALADSIDPERFGVSRRFIGESTARGDAGPGSDIDLYVLCHGETEQREMLAAWIEGWSLCLAGEALRQTGHPFPGGILNVRWSTQEPDIRQRDGLHELTLGVT